MPSPSGAVVAFIFAQIRPSQIRPSPSMRRPLRRPSSPVFVRAAHQRPPPGAPLRVRPRRIRPPSRPPVADPAPPRPWSAPRRPWSAQIRPSRIRRRPACSVTGPPPRRRPSGCPPPRRRPARRGPSARPLLLCCASLLCCCSGPSVRPWWHVRESAHFSFSATYGPASIFWASNPC